MSDGAVASVGTIERETNTFPSITTCPHQGWLALSLYPFVLVIDYFTKYIQDVFRCLLFASDIVFIDET